MMTQRYRPIEYYALIGDGLTAALISRGGSIDWVCFPRFDSPSVFARMLDADAGGTWRITPAENFVAERHYVLDTNVLVTTFRTATGRAELVDFMPAPSTGPDRLGDSAIVRILRGQEGGWRSTGSSSRASIMDAARPSGACRSDAAPVPSTGMPH